MFSEQQKATYQSIRAPQELYDKVMAARKPARRWTSYVPTLAAACLVLVLGVSFFIRGGDPNIVINGQSLVSSVEYYDTAPAFEFRSVPTVTVPVELELPRATRVSVTAGELTCDGMETGTELKVSGSVTLYWQIPRDADPAQCEMHIGTGRNATVLTYEYEETKIILTKKGD